MPWKETEVKDQRIEFVVRAKQEGVNLSSLCREYGITRPTGYLWLKRFDETQCLNDVGEKSRRPHLSPLKIERRIERAIIALRKKYGWGGRKLNVLLKAKGIEVCESTIDRVIKRNDLIETELRHPKAVKRFAMLKPNELWQMDFKGQFLMKKESYCFPLTILDDHSRYSVSITALRSTALKGVQEALIRAFKKNGVPKAMLMDHGTPWWSTTNHYGLTHLCVELIKQGIELKYSGIGHPQTQGKIERFHRSLKLAILREGYSETLEEYAKRFDTFRTIYNTVRPHEALDMEVPARRYERSEKEYEVNPRSWEYEEKDVRRLNTQGCLDYRGRRYFVCEALASESVSLTEFEERVLIKFRHMYVREIDLKNKRSYPVVRAST